MVVEGVVGTTGPSGVRQMAERGTPLEVTGWWGFPHAGQWAGLCSATGRRKGTTTSADREEERDHHQC